MSKGTPSHGKRGQKRKHVLCKRCGKKAFNRDREVCAACGFGKTSKRND